VVDALGAHRGLGQPAKLAIEHVEERGAGVGVAADARSRSRVTSPLFDTL
jgi:hypothetical protein